MPLPAHLTKLVVLVLVASTLFLHLLSVDTSFVPGRFKQAPSLLVADAGGYRPLPLRLSHFFPPPDATRQRYQEWNAQTLAELHSCIALGNCGPNQDKVALLAAHWFEEAVVRGWRGGEGVWALSVYKHLRGLGYTTLFANSFDEALQQYRMFPDLVKVVIRNKAGECHQDPACVKGPTNPSGIPAWKIFDFEFFTSTGHHFHASLMKGKWILSANPDNRDPTPIQYIGYSIEDDCRKIPTVRLADRANRVWMLMKQLTYVYDTSFAWNRSYFSLASNALGGVAGIIPASSSSNNRGIDFVGAWQINQDYQWDPEKNGIMVDIEDRARGVVNLGKLGPKAFTEAVGMSRVMVGMGNPWWSPSPYYALCMGVPFVNPILNWNRGDPWNKTQWHTQHPSLQRFEPPYVYHVHARDYEGFVAAIRNASTTEIPSFIPKHMTETAVRDRLRNLMETDWRAQAEVLLKERLAEAEQGGKPYIFEL